MTSWHTDFSIAHSVIPRGRYLSLGTVFLSNIFQLKPFSTSLSTKVTEFLISKAKALQERWMERGVKFWAVPLGQQLAQFRLGSLQAALASIRLKLSHVGRAGARQGARLERETQPAFVFLWGLHSETIFSQGWKLKPCCPSIYKGEWAALMRWSYGCQGKGLDVVPACPYPGLPPGVGQWGNLSSSPGWRTCLASHHWGVRGWQSS